MRVTATVVQSCQELAIAAADSMGSSGADARPTLNVNCSRGRSYAVGVGRAQLIERGVALGQTGLGSHRFEVLLAGEGAAVHAVPATGTGQSYALQVPGGLTAIGAGAGGSIVVSVTF